MYVDIRSMRVERVAPQHPIEKRNQTAILDETSKMGNLRSLDSRDRGIAGLEAMDLC